MPKIIHNGVEYGGGGYSKRQIDEKLKLKLSKSSIDTVLSDDSINPVQNKVVTKALNDKISQVKIMPTSATDGVAVLFTGTTTADYKQGHVYQYSETDAVWVDITDAVIENVDSLPEKNIKDIFYRIGGGEWVTKIVALSPDPDDTIEQLEAIGFTVLKDHYQESTNTRDVSFKGDNNHFGYVSHSYLYRIGIINATWSLSSGRYMIEGTGNDGHVSIVVLGSERKEDANFRVLAQNELWAGDSETQTIRRVAWDDEVTIQYEIMPTPSENELDKIVQYVGETAGSYIKGFFYRCVEVPDTDPTEYEWANQEVQESTDGEVKVNATAVTSLSGLADGFYLLIDSTATPIYQLKEIADGTATDSDKEVDTCLIDYVLYNDNKTVLDTLDIVWVVTGTPDVSDYKTEFETAKSGVRSNADYTFEWDSDILSVGDFADFKSQWSDFAVFMHNNKGRLAMITIDQYNFGFSDDDTGGSSPTLICIIPEIAQTTEDYSIRIPYGSAISTHCDGYGFGFIDINWRLAVSSGKCDFAGINTILFKGTDSMTTGYVYNGSNASSVYINETEYSMNDATERAAAYNLYHQGISIIVKLL